jgi:hypothetical protein
MRDLREAARRVQPPDRARKAGHDKDAGMIALNAKYVNIATTVATFFLVVVGIWGVLTTKNALKLTERAWISPVNAALQLPIEKGKPVRFNVIFINSGREPAVDVNYYYVNSTTDSFSDDIDIKTIELGVNTSCDNLMPESGTNIPPSGSSQFATGIWATMDSLRGKPPYEVDDKVLNGDRFYVVKGCASYRTFKEIHHSGFCYILLGPKSSAKWQFIPYPRGFPLS